MISRLAIFSIFICFYTFYVFVFHFALVYTTASVCVAADGITNNNHHGNNNSINQSKHLTLVQTFISLSKQWGPTKMEAKCLLTLVTVL